MIELLAGKAGVLTGNLQYGVSLARTSPVIICRFGINNGRLQ